ncbi:tRNA-specific adenosine deaminase [Spiroplasma helicoides]|uniref:tRNA-specific adenosine deaminase n=1 Tax=Spiroplasma helicoides TaxID=216938 RepID=A0A1B3SJ56_9MOLU|nr:nucleoside deaminase [Spiroplasma helicoides]AOG59961.1 tRNA-specific adenosine deaminase [Spiroplasma helicoides]
MKSKIIDVLKKEIKKCSKSDDVPVAAAIVLDNNVIASSRNSRIKNNDILGHAEIQVINKMIKKTKSKNLSLYSLIVTLKPCLMCIAAIEQCNIKNVYYFLENEKCDYSKYKTNIIFIKEELNEDDTFKKTLKDFFKNLRNTM